MKFAMRPWVFAMLCEKSKQAVNLGVQDIEPPRTGNPEIVDTESSIAEI
jgi:hypothetical protein